MLRSIKAAHAGVALGPDDEIDWAEAELRRGRMDGRQPAPIDESAEQAAVGEAIERGLHPGEVEGVELRRLISPEAMANSRCGPPVTLPEMRTL